MYVVLIIMMKNIQRIYCMAYSTKCVGTGAAGMCRLYNIAYNLR